MKERVVGAEQFWEGHADLRPFSLSRETGGLWEEEGLSVCLSQWARGSLLRTGTRASRRIPSKAFLKRP